MLDLEFLWKSHSECPARRQSPDECPSHQQHGPLPRHTTLPVTDGYKRRRVLPRTPPVPPGKWLTSSAWRSLQPFRELQPCHPPSACCLEDSQRKILRCCLSQREPSRPRAPRRLHSCQ